MPVAIIAPILGQGMDRWHAPAANGRSADAEVAFLAWGGTCRRGLRRTICLAEEGYATIRLSPNRRGHAAAITRTRLAFIRRAPAVQPANLCRVAQKDAAIYKAAEQARRILGVRLIGRRRRICRGVGTYSTGVGVRRLTTRAGGTCYGGDGGVKPPDAKAWAGRYVAIKERPKAWTRTGPDFRRLLKAIDGTQKRAP